MAKKVSNFNRKKGLKYNVKVSPHIVYYVSIHRVPHLFQTLRIFPNLETSQISTFEAPVVLLDIHVLIIDVPIPKMPFSHFKILFRNLHEQKLKARLDSV
mgnify:FL=1